MSSFLGRAAATVLALFAHSAEPQVRTLESSEHDRLRVEIARTALPGGDLDLPPQIGARLVAVCMVNATGAAKGFDNRRAAPPRRIAPEGHLVCDRFEPTEHEFYFFKERQGGRFDAVLSYRLDLRERDGLQVRIDWLEDGT